MTATNGQLDPYRLDSAFERKVILLLTSSPRFYDRIGREVRPELLGHPAAQLAARAASLVAKDVGGGPSSATLVIQRLTSLRDEGKITQADIDAVVDLLDRAEDDVIDADAVASELRPVVQRRLEQAALKEAVESYSKRGSLEASAQKLIHASRVGLASAGVGLILSVAALDSIRALRFGSRLPIGVSGIDDRIGGLHTGALGMWCSVSGGGKSMALAHNAAVAACSGRSVAYVTLELPRAVVLARIMANLTETPVTNILDGVDEAIVAARLGHVAHGAITVEYMSPGATAEDVIAWVGRVEQEMGARVDLLVVDYIDKLRDPAKPSRYEAGESIADRIRSWTEERQRWTWTASQATRRQGKRVVIGMDDTADSMGKPRVADLWGSINVRNVMGLGMEVTHWIDKNRHGEAHFASEPAFAEYAFGRIVGSDIIRDARDFVFDSPGVLMGSV